MSIQYVTTQHMKKIDKKAVEYGMPIELMMENAGREICNYTLKKIRKGKNKILIIAGKGNNGGGVLAASRHLTSYGICVKIVVLGKKKITQYSHQTKSFSSQEKFKGRYYLYLRKFGESFT